MPQPLAPSSSSSMAPRRPWLTVVALLGVVVAAVAAAANSGHAQDVLDRLTRAPCPDYSHYSRYTLHPPFSKGPLQLPFQRPAVHCRTFTSPLVEQVIEHMNAHMVDADLARLFENAFPNTLDTTVRWHRPASPNGDDHQSQGRWAGAQSFIVTGDINAEWLRDSTNQLAQYQPLAKKDRAVHDLILGAINTQAEFVITSPYCNAFQPPPPSRLAPSDNGQGDAVHPAYEPSFVFECKWELDSLAAFLSLSNQFYAHAGSTAFLTERWHKALSTLLAVLDEQGRGTFSADGAYEGNVYRFMRSTNVGTETLSLQGLGNPVCEGTGLIRSSFRPSDDATILPYLIPANAMMAVELGRAAAMLRQTGSPKLAATLQTRSDAIRAAVLKHGVVEHKRYGRVFAYEVDGYGSSIIMDDANLPSLLALPLLGFVEADDPVYQNTRRMVLDKAGNPYFLTGARFSGIGGPHIGLENAWPMSLLVRAMTASDDAEILESLELVKKASLRGLINESVKVDFLFDFTRSWFAWANSVFAQTILDLAKRKPHLLFGPGAKAYSVE